MRNPLISESLKAWLAFAAVAIFWGTTFFAIRIGVETIPPFLMAGIRQSVAGLIIVGYFLLRGYQKPSLSDLKHFTGTGFLMLLLGNGLVSWAVRYVPSGLAAIVCALTPIWMVVISAFGKQREVINWKVAVGFGVCFIAQVMIFWNKTGELVNVNYALGILFVFIANIAWALGSILAKRSHVKIHPLYGAGLQMLTGGFMLLITGSLLGEWNQMHPNQDAIIAIVYLIVIGSILSYGCYMYILKRLPSAIVSTYAYINTMVAVFLGYLFLSESLTFDMLIGVLFTIAGVWIVTKNFSPA